MQEVNCLRDTMHILAQGYYIKDGKKVPLQLSRNERKEVRVFLPPEVHALESYKPERRIFTIGRCGYSCENIDSFTKARNNYRDFRYLFTDRDKEILVLNFANPVHPGGGVRQGAKAQEEDLCRTSSLLCSLESEGAASYYQYNRKLHTYMGSDAVMITPKVEIIKDAAGNLLDESVIVAVMTCAAPILRHGLEGLSEQQYKALFYNRITGMLRVAAVCGYRYLVLGAFGCGAFGNDAEVVACIQNESTIREALQVAAEAFLGRGDFSLHVHLFGCDVGQRVLFAGFEADVAGQLCGKGCELVYAVGIDID